MIKITLKFGCECGARLWIVQQISCLLISLLVEFILLMHLIRALRRHDYDCALIDSGAFLMVLAAGVISPTNTLVHFYHPPMRIKLGLLFWTYLSSLCVGVVAFSVGTFRIMTRRPTVPFGGLEE